MMLYARISVGLAVALVLAIASPGIALGIANDAVKRCHATNVVESVGADVSEFDQYSHFTSVMADDGSAEDMMCGDGKNWGAVHIEVKHRVEDWVVAKDCMRNIMSNVKPENRC